MEKTLKIRTNSIPPLGLELSESLSASDLSELLKEPQEGLIWRATGVSTFSVSIEHEADFFHLKMHGSFRLICPCARCMNDVEFEVPLHVDMRLKPAASQTTGFEQDDTGEDEGFVVANFTNDTIDLGSILREELFLSVPSYPACDHEEALSKKVCEGSQWITSESAANPAESKLATLLKAKLYAKQP